MAWNSAAELRAGVIGGMTALPVWEFLKRVNTKDKAI